MEVIIGPVAEWLEYSTVIQENSVQVESYQRFKN